MSQLTSSRPWLWISVAALCVLMIGLAVQFGGAIDLLGAMQALHGN